MFRVLLAIVVFGTLESTAFGTVLAIATALPRGQVETARPMAAPQGPYCVPHWMVSGYMPCPPGR